jgi:nicotinate phosphoribosyltransferase
VRARAILDAAGLPEVRIVASGGLDEYAVDELVRTGTPIDVYAVGTRVGVSADAPYLDSAYKLVECDGRSVLKLSSAKVTAPGQKQVFRGPGYGDVIVMRNEPPPAQGEPLLVTMMEGVKRTGKRATVREGGERFTADLAGLPPAARGIHAPVAPHLCAALVVTGDGGTVKERTSCETVYGAAFGTALGAGSAHASAIACVSQ